MKKARPLQRRGAIPANERTSARNMSSRFQVYNHVSPWRRWLAGAQSRSKKKEECNWQGISRSHGFNGPLMRLLYIPGINPAASEGNRKRLLLLLCRFISEMLFIFRDHLFPVSTRRTAALSPRPRLLWMIEQPRSARNSLGAVHGARTGCG